MNRGWLLAIFFASLSATAQAGQEITFFSNPGMGGAQFTVTGARTNLALPYTARSAALRESGRWQVCSDTEYKGRCMTLDADQRDLSFGTIRSIRPLVASVPVDPWRELARLNVKDRAERDLVAVSDRSTLFREVKVCSERNTIRIRRAEVQLGNGTWQRMFLPLVLTQGQCSDPITLLGNGRRVRAVRFEYEAWTAGMARGTISVKALPMVQAQPR